MYLYSNMSNKIPVYNALVNRALVCMPTNVTV